MTTITIKINERSKKGKAFLEFAKTFFAEGKDVEIIKSDDKKPKKENAAKIWHHKLSFLNEKECLELASQFEFSGGEMENIARKCVMYKILHEKNPNFEEVHSLCINEKWDTDRNRVKIGF